MPSAERYHGFINALRQNVRTFDAAEHDERRLAAALAILQGVVLYLHGDHEVMEERLTRPLGWLESAVNDAARGANPTALKPATSVSGRPTGLARDRVQGTLAFFLELLVVAAKVPPDEAGQLGQIITTCDQPQDRGCVVDRVIHVVALGERRDDEGGNARAQSEQISLRRRYMVPGAAERCGVGN